MHIARQGGLAPDGPGSTAWPFHTAPMLPPWEVSGQAVQQQEAWTHKWFAIHEDLAVDSGAELKIGAVSSRGADVRLAHDRRHLAQASAETEQEALHGAENGGRRGRGKGWLSVVVVVVVVVVVCGSALLFIFI